LASALGLQKQHLQQRGIVFKKVTINQLLSVLSGADSSHIKQQSGNNSQVMGEQ